MTSAFTSISRKDLKFMAEDIGPELVAVMSRDEVLKGLDREKQLHLIKSNFKELVKGAELVKLLAELPPDSRKQLLALLLTMQSS
jgi:hypothetical protein